MRDIKQFVPENGFLFKRVLKGGGGGGSQSHFPPEILAKSQSQLDFY